MKLDDYPPLLTPAQAADLLQVSRWTVYEKVRQHQLPAAHVGRLVRIPRDAVLEYLTQAVEQPDPRLTVLHRELARGKRRKAAAK